jgi:hypothetical protein
MNLHWSNQLIGRVLLAVTVAVVGWLLFKRPRPLKHRGLTAERLRSLVDALYFRGFDGGELRVGLDGAPEPIVRLTKRIVSPGTVHLDLARGAGPPARLEDPQQAAILLQESLGDSEDRFECVATLHRVSEGNVRIGWLP